MSNAQQLLDEVTFDEKEQADANISKILKNLKDSETIIKFNGGNK